MNRINVLHICNQLSVGGTERALEVFAKTINKTYFNVYVCGIYEGGVREQLIKQNGIEVFVASGNKEKLYKFCKDKAINVLHIHRSGKKEGFAIETAKRAGVPVIVETNVFGLCDSGLTEAMIDSHLLVSKMLTLKYVKNAHISVDQFINKGCVIYNPLNLKDFLSFKPSRKRIDDLKLELGVDKETPLICRVGRPDPWKWSSFTVDSLSHIVKQVPDVKLVIVGGISQNIKERIKKKKLLENVIETGPVSEEKLIELYHTIDILTHSSRIGESFGYTIAEAMAAGKPVVVNSTPWVDNAQIELVDHGITGYIANTPKTYADAVVHLLSKPKIREDFGRCGKEKVNKLFDATKITPMVEKIYLELLAQKDKYFDRNLISDYDNVEIHPTNQEILNFSNEYRDRLSKSYCNQYNLLEKFALRFKRFK